MMTAWLVPSARSTPTSPYMSIRTTLRVSPPLLCLPRPLLALTSSTLPSTVCIPFFPLPPHLTRAAGMSGLTSQPPMGAICSALEQTSLGTGIRYADIQALNLYWSQVRILYQCFEANVRASDSSVFAHEMPGGQYTNLMFQAAQLGLGTQWTEIKQKYIEANELCGNIIKVTPSSKVVGDFAQWMVQNKLSKQDVLDRAEELDFPSSVVEFFQGYLGPPVGGFPEPLRTKVIRNKPRIEGRPGASMEPLDFKKIKAELRSKFGKHITDADVTSYVMYPKVFEEYQAFIEKYGDLSVVPTRYFLGRPDVGEEMHISIEQGKTLIIRLMAVGPVIESRAQRDVWFEVNGEVCLRLFFSSSSFSHNITGPCRVRRGQQLSSRSRLAREGDERPWLGRRADVGCCH